MQARLWWPSQRTGLASQHEEATAAEGAREKGNASIYATEPSHVHSSLPSDP